MSPVTTDLAAMAAHVFRDAVTVMDPFGALRLGMLVIKRIKEFVMIKSINTQVDKSKRIEMLSYQLLAS